MLRVGWAGIPLGSLKSSRMPVLFCASIGLAFRITATLPKSKEDRLKQLISSAEASPAKTSASLAKEQASLKVPGQGSGPITEDSSGNSVPVRNGSLQKTSQFSEGEDLESFSETFSRSGMMRNGIVFQQEPLVRLTRGTESGSWPTSKASASGPDFARTLRPRSGGDDLATAVVRPWATRVASASINCSIAAALKEGKRLHPQGRYTLMTQVAELEATRWPTPTVRDWKDGTSIGAAPINGLLGRSVEPSKINGSLNPAFVEYLMGYPLGWTVLDVSETPSSRKSRTRSSKQSKS